MTTGLLMFKVEVNGKEIKVRAKDAAEAVQIAAAKHAGKTIGAARRARKTKAEMLTEKGVTTNGIPS